VTKKHRYHLSCEIGKRWEEGGEGGERWGEGERGGERGEREIEGAATLN